MKRPNVLLLYTDQQRWDTIRAGGNDLIHTPNLDRLAGRGTLFDNCFVNCPVCMPSRMSMLSGRYPAATGIKSNGVEYPKDSPCMWEVLKPYGYHTANIGKLHFRNHANPFRDHREPYGDYGFDTFIYSDEPGCYDDAFIKWVEENDPDQVEHCRVNTPPAWTGQHHYVHPRNTHEPYVFGGREDLTHTAFVAEETCSFLERHQHEPFFCISGFYAPHTPLNPPKKFVDMYNLDEMPLPIRNPGENHAGTDDKQWQKVKAYYYALISHVDHEVGRILDKLEKLGLSEDTLVVFTSDHGEYLGDHGKIQKGGAEDASSHVPLLVSWPKGFGTAAKRNSDIVEHVDLASTILDCCGVQVPPNMQGQSLRGALEENSRRPYTPKAQAFIENGSARQQHGYKALRTQSHLYIRDINGDERLYDLAQDPHQLTNVAQDPENRSVLAELRGQMVNSWFHAESRDLEKSADY